MSEGRSFCQSSPLPGPPRPSPALPAEGEGVGGTRVLFPMTTNQRLHPSSNARRPPLNYVPFRTASYVVCVATIPPTVCEGCCRGRIAAFDTQWNGRTR